MLWAWPKMPRSTFKPITRADFVPAKVFRGRSMNTPPADVKEGSGCVLCFYCTSTGNHARTIQFNVELFPAVSFVILDSANCVNR